MSKILLRIVTIAGLAIMIWGCSILIASRQAIHWPQTQGQVISSLLSIQHLPKFIDSSEDPKRWYGADVLYTYSVGGMSYVSGRITLQDHGVRSPISALKLMNKYRHQHDVIVYYDPADPQQAALEPGNIGDLFIPLILGVFMAFVGLFLLFQLPSEVTVQDMDSYYQQGVSYQKRGRRDLAHSEYNKMIVMYPNLVKGYSSRGNLYLQEGKWDEAIADLTIAIGIDPSDGSIYFNRANAYLGKNQYNQALADLERAKDMGYNVNPEILEKIRKGI